MSKVSKDIWNKEKDGNNKEKRSFLRYFIISTAICLVILFIKKDSVVRLIGAGFNIHRQNKEMKYYRKQISDLDRQIKVLSNDKDTLETFAREQYLFSEPGDDVYLTE
ncbi:MAG: septum formation initiator family protein [Bacteroidales bacterium]|nr:septum formation initiator family protein [Bacteroidales bacterium]